MGIGRDKIREESPRLSFASWIILGIALTIIYIVVINDNVCGGDNTIIRHLLSSKDSNSENYQASKHDGDSNNLPFFVAQNNNFGLQKSSVAQKITPDEQGGKEGDEPEWLHKFFCELKAADIAIAFFTYCLVIVTWELARITKFLWAAGEKQFEFLSSSQNKPIIDIVVYTCGKVSRAVSGRTTVVMTSSRHFAAFKIKNFGNGPAIIMETAYKSFYGKPDIITIPFPPDNANVRQTFTVGSNNESDDIFIGQPEFDLAEKKEIWIVIQVRYRDIFHRQFVSDYCFFSKNSGATYLAYSGHKKSDTRELKGSDLELAEARDG
jgi:hypothetical protein